MKEVMYVRVVLGVDVGATSTTVVLADARTGRILARRSLKTRRAAYDHMLLDIKQAVDDLLSQHGLGVGDLASVGVGVASAIKRGKILRGGNLEWAGQSIEYDLKNLFRLPVVVHNDAVMSALGQFCEMGAITQLVFVTWGTGIGVGRAELPAKRGEFPKAHDAEGGHVIIDLRSRRQCGCGGFGHWEALAGGDHLHELLGRHPADASDDDWRPILRSMAAGLHGLAMNFPDHALFVGGGVMMKQKGRFEELRQLYLDYDSTLRGNKPELGLPIFGEESGVYGAVHAARQLI